MRFQLLSCLVSREIEQIQMHTQVHAQGNGDDVCCACVRVCLTFAHGCRDPDRRWLQREHARQPPRPEAPSVRTNIVL